MTLLKLDLIVILRLRLVVMVRQSKVGWGREMLEYQRYPKRTKMERKKGRGTTRRISDKSRKNKDRYRGNTVYLEEEKIDKRNLY